VDRAFRLAARFAERDESLEDFLSQRRRGLPVLDGLVVEAIEPGSLHLRLRPSKRMRKHLKKQGLAELALAVAILNGAFDFVGKVLPDAPDDRPARMQQPAPPPQAEYRIVVVVKRGDETSRIVIVATGTGYRLDAATEDPPILDP
jgi:hypothetical protein